MSSIKNIYGAILFSCCSLILNAQAPVDNGKKMPFTLTGNMGTSANFYSSNEQVETRPSYAWNAYGNFTAKFDKLIMPFSFVVNQYSHSNKSPFYQVGISPTYKWAKLHVGDRYMQFSPLVFEGQNFRGIGLELNPKQFRFAAFYGRLNKAVDENTTNNTFRVPQYSRTGYGVKIGYGNSTRFIDLIYFHAKDDSSSAKFAGSSSKKNTLARENAVLGLSGKMTILKKLFFLADLAVSGLTQDLSLGKKDTDSLTKTLTKLTGNFLTYNASTVANYAGQFSMIFNTTGYNTNFGYRRVQPEFKSFGTPYMINDIELISWSNYFFIAKGKVSANTTLSTQHNNLDKNLDTELRTFTGGIFINAIIKANFNLNLGCSGYSFKNRPGVVALDDNIRLDQKIYQFNFSPSYNLAKGDKLHYVTSNIGLSVLDDKNKITSDLNNSNNLSASLNYTIALIKTSCSFSVNGIYSKYKQDTISYNSYGGIIGASSQLLKNKTLSIQGSVGYVVSHFNAAGSQSNLTYDINIGYRLKNHSFSLFGNYIYTPPNAINDRISKTIPYAVATKNIAGGLSYAYSF